MDDLVKRLLAGTGGGKGWMDLHEEAADEITHLRAKLEECLECNEEFSALEKVHKKQIAALEARIATADARKEALREAYQNLRTFAPHHEHNTGPEHDIGYADGYHTAMNRILALALAKKDADNG